MLSLKKGKVAKVLDSSFSKDWWKVLYDGKVGLVPSNHMKLLSQAEAEEYWKKQKEEEERLAREEREKEEKLVREEREKQEKLAREEKEKEEEERRAKEKKKQEEKERIEKLIVEKAKKREEQLEKEKEEKALQEKVKAAQGKVFGVPLLVLKEREGSPIPKFFSALLKSLSKCKIFLKNNLFMGGLIKIIF